MVFMARGGGLLWLEITMRFLARRHERRCLPLFLKAARRAEAIGSDSLFVCEKHRMAVAAQRASHDRWRWRCGAPTAR
jgi:alkanesulfonate monooxygenase SsuD/methylene tetrahydromethanopterin reductase-like flavin-dependent oxidoreductase (luciferase family)